MLLVVKVEVHYKGKKFYMNNTNYV